MIYMKKEIDIVRYNPNFKEGLSSEQVKERQANKLTNKTKLVVGKSYAEIIFTNVLSFFNITLFAIAVVMIIYGLYKNLFFLTVLIPNIVIGLVQDIKSRVLMGKLKLMTAPKVNVIRNGVKSTINSRDVLLDDIILLKSSNQIPMKFSLSKVFDEDEEILLKRRLEGKSDEEGSHEEEDITCEEDEYLDTTKNECVKCSKEFEGCDECQEKECSHCIDGYFLNNKKCKKCSSNRISKTANSN